jgi:hypothetical protein
VSYNEDRSLNGLQGNTLDLQVQVHPQEGSA